jgi:nuclear pore complex protein Nup133
LVAYVIFERAVVIISMAKQPDSPESQLRLESHLLPLSFEDVVDFRDDINVEIVGSGMEELQAPSHVIEDSKSRRHKAKHPAVVLLVRGGGVVRVAATDITRLTSNKAQQVTSRSKLEQAVFFGTLDQNLLNFAVRPELQFSAEEVGEAALDLSLDISKSETPYIPAVPASVEQNLKKRSAALRDLAQYLKASGVTLDRATKWKLLWAAEKMSAAGAIWKLYDASLKRKRVGEKRGLLTELIEFIHEDYKTEPVSEAGELDRVRHWFIKDVWNLEIAIPWAYQVIKYTYQDGKKNHDGICDLLSEGNDMVLGALKAAFDFRTANLDLYGLGHEILEHGVLKDDYHSLPEFWTSTIFITENLRKQTELAGLLLKSYWGNDADGDEGGHLRSTEKVRGEFSDLLDITIRSNRERIRWDLCQNTEAERNEADRIRVLLDEAQHRQILELAQDLELPDSAADLAEKHELLPSLALVLQHGLRDNSSKVWNKTLSEERRDFYNRRYHSLRNRVRQCFDKFGAPWATALFEVDIGQREMADLFDGWPEQQEFLTAFLRKNKEYAKISWMNDVLKEDDFDQAAKTLLSLGLEEKDLWSKQVELSLSKLARLAERESSQASEISMPEKVKSELLPTHNQLGLIKIQDAVFEFVLPFIEPAIDEKAEQQLAMETFGNNHLIKQPKLLSLLREGMTSLVKHEAMKAPSLIDLLTLMDGSASGEMDHLRSQQFFLALKAVRYGIESKDEQILTQRIIWRRCMLRDNWAEINNTADKDDQQVSEQLAQTALYQTLRECYNARKFALRNNVIQLTKAGLLDKKSPIKAMGPEEVVGAGTEYLGVRFANADASTQEQVMQDMIMEDEALKPLIERSRLEDWFNTAMTQARDDWEAELNEETDNGGRMEEVAAKLDGLEEAIRERETKRADDLLFLKPRYKPKARMNGSVQTFRSSVRP